MIAGMLLLLVLGWAWMPTAELENSVSLPDGLGDWSRTFRNYGAFLDGGIGGIIVIGESMRPAFIENDILLWVSHDYSSVRVGDVILFTHPDRGNILVTHRVIDINENGILTKGDWSERNDGFRITENEYQGLVMGVVFTSSQTWDST
jgi:signal peptidase I